MGGLYDLPRYSESYLHLDRYLRSDSRSLQTCEMMKGSQEVLIIALPIVRSP